jgi:hypothetical protein
LEEEGATIVEIGIPHLEAISKAHTVIIGTEIGGIMEKYISTKQIHELGDDVRVNMNILQHLHPLDYVAANRIRIKLFSQAPIFLIHQKVHLQWKSWPMCSKKWMWW